MIEPPLPFGNAAARWFYVLLKGLVARGHTVTAFATCSKSEEIKKAREVFPSPQYDLRCYTHSRRSGLHGKLETLRRPYSYMFSSEFERDLKTELSQGFDILHLEQAWAGWLGLEYKTRSLLNVHHLVGIDLEETRGHWLMIRTERKLIQAYPFVRSCSPRLIAPIQSSNPRTHITTIPVAIDATQYRFISDSERGRDPVVSIIGTMNWHPTRSAAERFLNHLWPEIKKQIPNARAQIVGWDAKKVLARYLNTPDLIVEENVPNIQPYFDRTSVLLYAPQRGSGMKIKILEAMAFGVPVVTTSEGVEGLPARDGIEAGVCDDNEGLIARTVALIRNTQAQNTQRAAARKLIESHCSPQAALDAIEENYKTILKKRTS